MNRIKRRFKELTLAKKVQLIAAILLMIGLMAAVPAYAWFTNQKKAAEMFKVQYPNSLYINAAHREDQCHLKLDGININKYAEDPITGLLLTDERGEKIKVDKYQYVFSVSGASTNEFELQMAHTNNNLFTYKLYEAENYTSCTESNNNGTLTYTLVGNNITGAQKTTTVPGENKERIIKYTHKANTHNENKLRVIGDNYVNDSQEELYYLRGDSEITGANAGYKNRSGALAIKSTDNSYYTKTYGDNLNVEEHSVPLYWQGRFNVVSDSNKYFCKYFVLEVTWNENEQASQTKKETDMVYFAVKRIS